MKTVREYLMMLPKDMASKAIMCAEKYYHRDSPLISSRYGTKKSILDKALYVGLGKFSTNVLVARAFDNAICYCNVPKSIFYPSSPFIIYEAIASGEIELNEEGDSNELV